MRARKATNEQRIEQLERQFQALLIAVSALQDTKQTPITIMAAPPQLPAIQYIPIIGTIANNDFISIESLSAKFKDNPL